MITFQRLKRARKYFSIVRNSYDALREKRRQDDLVVELERYHHQIGRIAADRDEAVKRYRDQSSLLDALAAQREAALKECKDQSVSVAELVAQRDAAIKECEYQSRQLQVLASQRDAEARKLLELQLVSPPSPETQSHSARARFVEFLRLIRPFEAVQRTKIRVGGPNDGGYVMIDDFSASTVAVSIGVGTDVSWDLDIAERGICVLQFDHSVHSPPVSHPKLSFFQNRVVADNDDYEGGITLEHILSKQLCGQGDIVLKMDIEGDEWRVLASVPEHCLRNVSQMVIEFHSLQQFASAPWADRAFEVMKKLVRSHNPVHLHGNNHAGFAILGGIPFPDVFELTLLRNDRHEFVSGAKHWPTELDAPNNPARADLTIFFAPDW